MTDERKGDCRKHHLIPAFYLAGFTMSGSKRSLLHVFDFERRMRYKTTPLNACRQTDFYRVEEPGLDPNVIEEMLGRHETIVAPFVRKIARGGRADNRKEVAEAISLAASILVRSRWARELIEQSTALNIVKKLRRNEVTRAQWDQLRDAALRDGMKKENVPDYENAIYRARSGYWLPPVPSPIRVGMVPELQEEVMKRLTKRDWELHATTSNDHAGFICSDSPLAWGDLRERLSGRSASFDDPGVEVSFPVSRNAALVSYPGAYNGNKRTTDEVVAHVNARTLHLSTGLLFHAEEHFLLERDIGDVRSSTEFFAHVEARDKGIVLP